MVEKYGLPKSEAPHFCLVQSNLSMPEDGAPGVVVGGGTTREYILDDDDCPLNILMNHQVGKFYGEIFCDLCISRRAKERSLFTFVGDQVREVLDQGGGKRSRLRGRAEGDSVVKYLTRTLTLQEEQLLPNAG